MKLKETISAAVATKFEVSDYAMNFKRLPQLPDGARYLDRSNAQVGEVVRMRMTRLSSGFDGLVIAITDRGERIVTMDYNHNVRESFNRILDGESVKDVLECGGKAKKMSNTPIKVSEQVDPELVSTMNNLFTLMTINKGHIDNAVDKFSVEMNNFASDKKADFSASTKLLYKAVNNAKDFIRNAKAATNFMSNFG